MLRFCNNWQNPIQNSILREMLNQWQFECTKSQKSKICLVPKNRQHTGDFFAFLFLLVHFPFLFKCYLIKLKPCLETDTKIPWYIVQVANAGNIFVYYSIYDLLLILMNFIGFLHFSTKNHSDIRKPNRNRPRKWPQIPMYYDLFPEPSFSFICVVLF